MAEPVREEDLRAAKDVVLEGIADTQTRAGLIPDLGLAEKWYAPILDQSAKEIEEQRAKEPAPAPKQAPVKERAEDDPVKTRALGEVNMATGAFQPTAAMKPRRVPTFEEQWIQMRMRLLMTFPDWKARLRRAFVDPGTKCERAARMMNVLDQSSAIFGDWRSPKMPGSVLHFT